MVLSEALAFLGASTLAYIVLDNLNMLRPANAPPLVRGLLPYVGCHYEIRSERSMEFLERQRRKYGDIFSVRAGGRELVYVFDTSVLSRYFRAPEEVLSINGAQLSYGLALVFMGDRIPGQADGELAPELMQTFVRRVVPHIRKHEHVVQEVVDEFIEKRLAPAGTDSGVWHTKQAAWELTKRAAIRVMLGPELVQNDEFAEFVMTLPHLFDEMSQTLHPGWPFVIRRAMKYHARFNAYMQPALEERRAWQREDLEGWLEKHKCSDFFSILIDSYPYGSVKGMTDGQLDRALLRQVAALLFAANGNSPQSIEGTFAAIVAHRDVYDKVVGELDTTLRAHAQARTREPSASPPASASSNSCQTPLAGISIRELSYLSACQKEYQRLNGVPGVAHQVKSRGGFRLSNGYVAPYNSILHVCPYVMMRDPAHFSEPEKFRPERVFEEQFRRNEVDMIYSAFGGGKHKCLGIRTVTSMMKIIIGTILRDFDVSPHTSSPADATRRDSGADGFSGNAAAPVASTGSVDRLVQIKFRRREQPLGLPMKR